MKMFLQYITSLVSVVSLYTFFLTYDAFLNPTLKLIRDFVFLLFIAQDSIFRFINRKSDGFSATQFMVGGTSLLAYLLFQVRMYIDIPSRSGVAEQVRSLPKVRDFLLVMVVLLSIVALLYQVMLLLSKQSESVQAGIGKDKKTLLQNTVYSFLYISPLLIAINYLAVQRNYNFDLSSVGKFSYSEVSRSILKAIDRDVKVTAFYPRPLEASGKEESWTLSAIRPDIEIYLQKLTAINPRITVEFINADVETDKLGDFPNAGNGTIVIRSLKTTNHLDGNPYSEEKILVAVKKDLEDLERKIVQSINNVTLPQKKVYFTTLNGERFGTSYSGNPGELTTKLINSLNFFNYSAKGIGLNEGFPGKIPEDAELLILAGPTVPYSEEARKTILNFVENKRGQVLIAIDPFGNEDFSWLLSLTKLELKKENLRQAKGRVEIVATGLPEHPISESFAKKDLGLVFPYSGYFEKNLTQTEFKFTDTAILETGFSVYVDKNKNEQMDGEEKQNNYLLGSLLTVANQEVVDPNQAGEVVPGRILVFSGHAWLTDRYFLYNLNPSFLTNSVNWMFRSPLIQSILPKKEDVPVITLTSNQKVIIWSLGLFGYPGFLILALSLYVSHARRKKSS
jgi:hypothetical protein